MKIKSLSQEEFQKILEAGGKLIFDTKSPFSQITAPPEMIFFAYHWDQLELRGATGTAYICRSGKLENLLDFDIYSLRRSSNEGYSEIQIVDIKKSNIEYHHTNDLPKIIKEQAPAWVNNKIQNLLKQNNPNMPTKKKVVLFDFDGVIADSFEIAFEINKIIDSKIVTENDYQKLFDGNINDWKKDSSYSKEETKRINEEFFVRYIPQMEKVKMFPGMKEVIMELREKYILIIISSTIISPIRDFLKRNNILSYFDEIVGSNDIDKNKTERIKMVFEKYEVGAKDCVFITDTLGDMREAASIDIQSIGVNWGFQEKENLLRGNPFCIADKPGDLNSIISEYFDKN